MQAGVRPPCIIFSERKSAVRGKTLLSEGDPVIRREDLSSEEEICHKEAEHGTDSERK